MRVLFWGTPEFALPSLRALAGEGHHVVGVVTQPDRPAGRGRSLRPSPVKSLALQEGLPVLTPERPRGEAFLEEIRALDPELSVVAAYGHILRPEVLNLPPLGSVNVHASLLPELRGAAPINWAIVRGHEVTGVSIMQMDEGLDSGPVFLEMEEPISPRTTAAELYVRLSELGAVALVETLGLMEAGMAEAEAQDHTAATYAPKVDRETARLDWELSASALGRWVRGMDDFPGAWSTLEGEPVKLFRPLPDDEAAAGGPPGEIVRADAEGGIRIATGQGVLEVEEVQPPGKRRMPAADWIRGRGCEVGQRFV